MSRRTIMVVAGEPSGDLLAAELVHELRQQINSTGAFSTFDRQPLSTSLEPEFIGAGGPAMAKAGVRLAFDMTQHAVVGLWEVIKKYREFKSLFHQLFEVARVQQPELLICVDFSGFNLRFGEAIRKYARSLEGTFANWNPLIVQYVSPQVWASRPRRADRLAKSFDLLLTLLPFEKDWYRQRTPRLRVEFVGHPLIDRYGGKSNPPRINARTDTRADSTHASEILLLPGSRAGELRRHLPVLRDAANIIQQNVPNCRIRLVLPNQGLLNFAREMNLLFDVEIQVGELSDALLRANVALASTGTVTLECAYFGVPTIAFYKTSAFTYAVGKRLVLVDHLAMPNILAGEELFPEFIQEQATGNNLAQAAMKLLTNEQLRNQIRSKLSRVASSLGTVGASQRAAQFIIELANTNRRPLRAFLERRH